VLRSSTSDCSKPSLLDTIHYNTLHYTIPSPFPIANTSSYPPPPHTFVLRNSVLPPAQSHFERIQSSPVQSTRTTDVPGPIRPCFPRPKSPTSKFCASATLHPDAVERLDPRKTTHKSRQGKHVNYRHRITRHQTSDIKTIETFHPSI
jgi:hypothetical protein